MYATAPSKCLAYRCSLPHVRPVVAASDGLAPKAIQGLVVTVLVFVAYVGIFFVPAAVVVDERKEAVWGVPLNAETVVEMGQLSMGDGCSGLDRRKQRWPMGFTFVSTTCPNSSQSAVNCASYYFLQEYYLPYVGGDTGSDAPFFFTVSNFTNATHFSPLDGERFGNGTVTCMLCLAQLPDPKSPIRGSGCEHACGSTCRGRMDGSNCWMEAINEFAMLTCQCTPRLPRAPRSLSPTACSNRLIPTVLHPTHRHPTPPHSTRFLLFVH